MAEGNIIDITQRLAAKKSAEQHAPKLSPKHAPIFSSYRAILAANAHTDYLKKLVERSLYGPIVRKGFNDRFVPEMQFSVYGTPQSQNVISLEPTGNNKKFVHGCVTQGFALPDATRRVNSTDHDQHTASSLFIVAYALAKHALTNHNQKGRNLKPINDAVWNRTPEDVLPTPEANAVRGAAFVVWHHFSFEPLHGFAHDVGDVLPVHVAGLYDPLDKGAARTLYEPLM